MSLEDKAQEHELAEWERNNRPSGQPFRFSQAEAGYGPAECEECEDAMPTVRREYGYCLCVSCANLKEQLTRRHLSY